MSRNYSRAEYENVKRQRSIAWAKYYELKRESAQNAYLILQMVMDTIPRMNGELQRPPQLPPHITHELFDMADAATDETQDAEEGVWLLGTPFFRHFTVVFDFDERKVGFAKTKKLHASFLRSRQGGDGLVTVPLQRVERVPH